MGELRRMMNAGQQSQVVNGSDSLPDLPDEGQPLFFNQELSWLQFNLRVLEEALDQDLPLLERVRFLSIFANNLDEFFMVRVSGLRGQLTGGVFQTPPDGMTPAQQLMAIREILTGQLAQVAACWSTDLRPRLRDENIHVLDYGDLNEGQVGRLREYFGREVFPVLTPLAFDPAHPFPHISNLSLNLAVVVKDARGREGFARLKVADGLPRLVPVPGEGNFEASIEPGAAPIGGNFVWIEDVVTANIDMLFPGVEIVDAYPFRITRDADFDMKDDVSDLLTNIEELIEMRHWGAVVRLELDHGTPDRIRDILMRNLDLTPDQVYLSREHLGFADFAELCRIDRPDLKYAPHIPYVPDILANRTSSIFDVIPDEGLLLYHPYDSFMPVVDLIREAANDPQVLAIKQTLYRVGANTPIVDALKEARQNGKQVAVLLEIQARFDEENNIAWARQLEDDGVHVVYGVLGLKTHAKMSLVVRREPQGLRRYVHLSTGNYNTVTSRLYTDISFITKDPEISADVGEVFNALTGFGGQNHFRKLLVAPSKLRDEMITRIDREIAQHREHGDGYIAMKMNALVDRTCIYALYRASQAGVKIDLQVRGMCCLRPGVPGLSETINVSSIVGRFLEHARIYYFRNGGNEELFLGSADLMPRNLDRRVETVFPIESPRLRKRILHEILEVHLRDTAQARRLLPDGTYERMTPDVGVAALSSQEWMMTNWRGGT